VVVAPETAENIALSFSQLSFSKLSFSNNGHVKADRADAHSI
jgi:hypothetical protein